MDLEDDYAALKRKASNLKDQYVDENNQTVSFTVYVEQEQLGELLKRARKIKAEARTFLKKSVDEFDSMNDRIDDLEDDIYHSYEVKDSHSSR